MNPKQIFFALAAAFIGLVIGGLYGSQQDPGYQTTHAVALDEVVRSGGQSGTRVVSFITTVQQDETKDRAAEASGLDRAGFDGIFASRTDDSMVIEVQARTSSTDGASDHVAALIQAALLEEIEAERATEQIIVDASSEEVAALEMELASIYDDTSLVRGENLAERRSRDQFNLDSAIAQLAALPDDETYWNIRLPGDIDAYETRLTAIDLRLDRWLEINERLDLLDDTHGDAVRRLAELEASDEIAAAGTAVLRGDTSALSSRATAGRWAAVIGAFSFVGALAFLGIGSMLSRRRLPVVPAAERTSAATS